MPNGEHDTLVYRLSQILVKLNQGENLSLPALAEEFGVHVRTVQRDLNVRFAYLPINKVEGHYSLDPIYLGKLSRKDIDRFASLAGVKGLFPSLNNYFLRKIFDVAAEPVLLVTGHNYEDLTSKGLEFDQIKSAISNKQQLKFQYQKVNELKSYDEVSPYKLMNHHGIWYLVGVDGDMVKTFAFNKIQKIELLNKVFAYDSEIEQRLLEEDGIWFSQQEIEVKLKISKEISGYFQRRKLIANQEIEKTFEDGSLILKTKVGHINQVLPIIKYWIPFISVLSPKDLREKLFDQLNYYLSNQ